MTNEQMSAEEEDLFADICNEMYRFLTLKTKAKNAKCNQEENDCPGFILPELKTTHFKSCSAFRQWQLFAHDKVLSVSVDGHRAARGLGRPLLQVVVDGAEFCFPIDDGRGNHPLTMSVLNGRGGIFNVVNWSDAIPRVERMVSDLRETGDEIQRRTNEASKEKLKNQEEKRSLLHAKITEALQLSAEA